MLNLNACITRNTHFVTTDVIIEVNIPQASALAPGGASSPVPSKVTVPAISKNTLDSALIGGGGDFTEYHVSGGTTTTTYGGGYNGYNANNYGSYGAPSGSSYNANNGASSYNYANGSSYNYANGGTGTSPLPPKQEHVVFVSGGGGKYPLTNGTASTGANGGGTISSTGTTKLPSNRSTPDLSRSTADPSRSTGVSSSNSCPGAAGEDNILGTTVLSPSTMQQVDNAAGEYFPQNVGWRMQQQYGWGRPQQYGGARAKEGVVQPQTAAGPLQPAGQHPTEGLADSKWTDDAQSDSRHQSYASPPTHDVHDQRNQSHSSDYVEPYQEANPFFGFLENPFGPVGAHRKNRRTPYTTHTSKNPSPFIINTKMCSAVTFFSHENVLRKP